MLLYPIVYFCFFGSVGLGVAFIWIKVNTLHSMLVLTM